jgi:hypothetical protein
MMHGCGDEDHASRVAKRPIKIRNEKRTKGTYRTCIVETSRVLLGEGHADGGGGLAARCLVPEKVR